MEAGDRGGRTGEYQDPSRKPRVEAGKLDCSRCLDSLGDQANGERRHFPNRWPPNAREPPGPGEAVPDLFRRAEFEGDFSCGGGGEGGFLPFGFRRRFSGLFSAPRGQHQWAPKADVWQRSVGVTAITPRRPRGPCPRGSRRCRAAVG